MFPRAKRLKSSRFTFLSLAYFFPPEDYYFIQSPFSAIMKNILHRKKLIEKNHRTVPVALFFLREYKSVKGLEHNFVYRNTSTRPRSPYLHYSPYTKTLRLTRVQISSLGRGPDCEILPVPLQYGFERECS